MAKKTRGGPYEQKAWLYEMYVVKRMKLTDIQKMLKERQGIEISQQALYAWCKKHDLLKYRGKGRSLKMRPAAGMKKMGISPQQKRINELRKRKRQMMKQRGK